MAAAVTGVVAYAYAGVGALTAEVQTTAVITLAMSALWVLGVLVRPFTRTTATIVVAAYASLLLVLCLPFTRDFLEFESLPITLVLAAFGASAVAITVLEVAHRRIRRQTSLGPGT